MKRILLVLILVLAFGFTSVEAQNFSTHQVKKGETIEAISKRYFVTPFDIYKLNPDAKKDLKPNTVLIIPISKAKKPTITINKEFQGFNEHKTKRKETLYSLSKKYNVSEDDIKKYNKFLYSNTLRKGDRLQIPKYKITKIVEEVEATKRYTVQPKEGKWRIAYKFGVTVEELEVLNPGITEVLKEGDVINVPNLKDEAEKQFDDQYSYYKVLPKEGFYRLKLKLDLEQDQLEALNPELKEIGLKSGMILKIPHSDAIEGLIEGESEVVNLVNSISDFETKHIAIMLPFRMHRVDFDSISDAKKSLKKDPYLNVSLDFHSGVLMALDSLKTLGISLKVDVYDTRYEVSEVSRIIRENDFENIDAVIGPLTPASFNKVASELEKYNTPVISPLSKERGLPLSNLYYTVPAEDLLRSSMFDYFKSKNGNVVAVISTKKTTSKDFIIANHPEVKHALFNDKGALDLVLLKKQLVKGKKNFVLMEIEKASTVVNLTKNLIELQKEYDIQLAVFEVYDTLNFEEISINNLAELKMLFPSTTKVVATPEEKIFEKEFKRINNVYPNAVAKKGFDVTFDALLRICQPEGFVTSAATTKTEYIESAFDYNSNNGLISNNASYLLYYDTDLTIKQAQ